MVIIGVDTDAKGSIAILDCRNVTSPILDIYAIPNRQKLLKNGTKRLGVNYPALVAIMVELTSRVPVDKFYLEEQWSRPMQDAGATFTFGQTFGDCRSATAAGLLSAGFSPDEIDQKIMYVPGGDWKYEMRLDSDKQKSLDLASQLFPDCAPAWKLKSKYTSAAEAALLALFGATKQGVKLSKGAVVKRPKSPILSVAHSLVFTGGK